MAWQVGDLPEDQITLRALRDVNVPKFLKVPFCREGFIMSYPEMEVNLEKMSISTG